MADVGRPLKFKSAEELSEKCAAYFEHRERNKLPLTITGLAVWLDTDRSVLMDYQNRDEFTNTVKAAKQRCEAYAEEQAFVGKNQAGSIFVLKNHGWRDQQHQDVTSNGQVLGVVVLPAKNAESTLEPAA